MICSSKPSLFAACCSWPQDAAGLPVNVNLGEETAITVCNFSHALKTQGEKTPQALQETRAASILTFPQPAPTKRKRSFSSRHRSRLPYGSQDTGIFQESEWQQNGLVRLTVFGQDPVSSGARRNMVACIILCALAEFGRHRVGRNSVPDCLLGSERCLLADLLRQIVCGQNLAELLRRVCGLAQNSNLFWAGGPDRFAGRHQTVFPADILRNTVCVQGSARLVCCWQLCDGW